MAGPVTKDTSSLALGLGQLRILDCEDNLGTINPAGTASNSIGALTKSMLNVEKEVWRHLSGFPQIEDHSITLSKRATIEADSEELNPYNIALALGVDPASYTLAHSGQIPLGGLTDLAFIRSELVYTFPDEEYTMIPVFPKAQVVSGVSVDFQAADSVKNPITIEAKRADSNVTGGSALWDDAPLGRIWFKDAS